MARDRREHFFMRHAQTHISSLTIFQAKHLVANREPAARLLPDLGGMKCRQKKLLTADGVHLFAKDVHDLPRDPLTQRQV